MPLSRKQIVVETPLILPKAQKNISHTQQSVISSSSYDLILAIADIFLLTIASTTTPGRLRLYTSSNKREADRNRNVTIDPSGNHGLLLEIVFTSTLLSIEPSPAIVGRVASGVFATFTPSQSTSENVLSFAYFLL